MHVIPIEGLNAIAWVMTALAVGLSIGRFFIHWRKNRKIRLDDVFNAAAAVLLIAYTTTYQLYVPSQYEAELYALGITDKPPVGLDPVRNSKFTVANILLFWLLLYAVKASFLALYWEIFEVSIRFRIAWAVTAVYITLSFAVTWVSVFWRCGLPKDVVNLEVCAARPMSRVINLLSMWCALNVFGDILLMVLPIAMLTSMKMCTSQKIGLALVFGLVTIDIVLDILRTVYTASMNFSNFPDQNTLWALLEPTIAVIVCALPCYRGLLSKRITGSSSPRSFGSLNIRSYFGPLRSNSEDVGNEAVKSDPSWLTVGPNKSIVEAPK